MTESELRAALDAARDHDEVRRVVRACGDCLRTASDVDHVGLSSTLLPLASHANEKVRQAVADACDTFPDPFFDRALDLLAADVDHYVRAAASRAAQRRAVKRKTFTKAEKQERVLTDLLSEIETKHGKGARRLGERCVRRGVEHVVGRLYHELSKTDHALDRALAALRAELSEPRPSIGAIRRQEEELREKVELVRAILQRGREYAAAAKGSFADESLASIVEEARAQLFARVGARAKAIDFTSDVDRALRLHADRHALLQALQNVLQNAVESYAPDASAPIRVEACARRNTSEIALRIVDHGEGMDDAARGRLFVPFATRKPGGTGVGLSIVRKMVEEIHSGEVSIDSAVGAGTVVTFVLPTRQPGVRE